MEGKLSSNKKNRNKVLPTLKLVGFTKGEHKEVFAYGIEAACDESMDGYLVIQFT